MKHDSITTETWATDDGFKIIAELKSRRVVNLYLELPGAPGSGNKRRIDIDKGSVRDLAEITAEANQFLNKPNRESTDSEDDESDPAETLSVRG